MVSYPTNCSSRPREVQNLGKSEFWEKKSLDNKSLLVVCILTPPTGSSKYCTTRKNIQRYYTPKRLIGQFSGPYSTVFEAAFVAKMFLDLSPSVLKFSS